MLAFTGCLWDPHYCIDIQAAVAGPQRAASASSGSQPRNSTKRNVNAGSDVEHSDSDDELEALTNSDDEDDDDDEDDESVGSDSDAGHLPCARFQLEGPFRSTQSPFFLFLFFRNK